MLGKQPREEALEERQEKRRGVVVADVSPTQHQVLVTKIENKYFSPQEFERLFLYNADSINNY